MSTLAFNIPGLRTVNPLNGSHGSHWAVTRRKQKERTAVVYSWPFGQLRDGLRPEQKAIVTLTRIGPRRMDDDGASASLKCVRDSVAKRLGIDDGNTARIAFLYRQEKGEHGVRIEIEVMG